jgi:hypothetical protein
MAEQDQQAPAQEAQAPQGPQITVSDLVLTAQILQTGAARGLFKAEEFKTVGDFYERLVAFLESSGAITRTPAPQAEAPAPQAETTEENTSVKTRRKAQ